MAPSSQRRAKTRKHEEVVEKSEVDEPETLATATPTRNKKRRLQEQTNDTPDRAEVAIAHQTSSASRRRPQPGIPGPDVVEQELDEEQIAELVSQFRSAHQLQARKDNSNETHEAERPDGMTAYAKIAGNGWTYYVTEIAIRLGRPPDERNMEGHAGYPPHEYHDDHAMVHLDLGPSKLVSRHHAEIRYDEAWTISVNGRNGIKLDEVPMQRGATRQLTNGSVIEIAGTQMLFCMPNSSPTVHPAVWAAIKAQEDEDEDDIDGFKAPPRPSQRTPGRGLSSGTGHLPSSSNNYQGRGGSNHYGRNHAGSGMAQHDGSADGLTSGAAQSPAFARGVMLDSTEDIDYSQDSAKDLKPPHSYAQLIGLAILWADEQRLTLSKIYDYIKENYAFYRFQGGGWQNSIRHNLSLNKCFEKVARRTDEPGKGMKWKIVDEHREEFMKRNINNPRKNGGARTSSVPNSPYKDRPTPASAGFDRSFLDNKPLENPFSRHAHALRKDKLLQRSSSPPNATYKTEQAATPERSSAYYKGAMGVPSSPTAYLNGLSPFPDYARSRSYVNGLNEAGAARTPAALAFQSNYDMHDTMATPLLGKHMPKFAPPSTARLPSQFMPLSSPAPFWKFTAEYPSSPAKLQHSSPMKLNGHAEAHDKRVSEPKAGSAERDDATAGSSSPPTADTEIGSGSPTGARNARGRSVSQQQASQKQPEMTEVSPARNSIMPHRPSPNSKITERRMHQQAPAQPVAKAVVAPALAASDDESEEEGHTMLDLVGGGFQSIGSFHRGMNAGVIRG